MKVNNESLLCTISCLLFTSINYIFWLFFYNDLRYLCHDLVFSEFRNRCNVLSVYVLQTSVNELWPCRKDILRIICNLGYIYIYMQILSFVCMCMPYNLCKFEIQREKNVYLLKGHMKNKWNWDRLFTNFRFLLNMLSGCVRKLGYEVRLHWHCRKDIWNAITAVCSQVFAQYLPHSYGSLHSLPPCQCLKSSPVFSKWSKYHRICHLNN